MWLLSVGAMAQNANPGEVPDSNGMTAGLSVTVGIDRLEQSPEMDISKALYNKIAGLNVYQGSGRPADNYASLSFHGHAPLILVDGFPRDLNSLTMAEIESVTVLKDAAALALYGVRGANGVVNITTKRGGITPLKIGVAYQFGLNTQFRSPEFADAYTYAQQLNGALKLDGLSERYSDKELNAFKTGVYPYAYPNVDWWKEVYKDYGTNHQLNLTFTGGNEKFRYYTVADYSYDRAMFKHSGDDSRYSTTPFDVRLNLRTNLDLDITKTTLLKVGLMGRMQEVNGPDAGVGAVYNAVYRIPSAAFPIKTENGVFGGNNVYGSTNPVAMLGSSGHRKYVYTTFYGDLRLRQDLSELTKGLYADVAVSFDYQGSLWENSSRTYRYCDLQSSMLEDGTVVTNPAIYDKDSEVVSHGDGMNRLYLRTDFQARVGYDRTFGDHHVSAAAVYDQQGDVNNGRNNTFKRQSLIGNVSYSYLNRYFVDAAISWSGTNVLPDHHRFKTYPAVSAAWLISEEDFMQTDFIDMLKLRASYGLSGWDGNTPHELFRQSYGWAGDYIFANGMGASGWNEGRLPVEDLTIEKSKRASGGFDVNMFRNRFQMSVDAFYEERSNILVDASNVVSGVVGIGVSQLNAGINKYRGVDISAGWKDKIGNWGYGVTGIFSFVRTKIVESGEAYQRYDYLYQKGNRVAQQYGLEAIGFFNDQVDINNSPVHTFSTVKPGDIKYRDQNGDGQIDAEDVVKMYQTSTPEIYYGFNLNLSWKNISVSADFQGIGNCTVNLLNSPLYQPLQDNSTISNTFLERETTWSPAHQTDATMPRLTTEANNNNYRNSSLWYRNGAFLKLRNLQVAYDIPKSALKFADLTVYLRGTNLFSADKIKFADPEQLFVSYPSVRSYWMGVKFNF